MVQPRSNLVRWAWALGALLGLCGLVLVLRGLQRPPRPLGGEATAEVFSATRAARHLEWIAKEPHPVGSAAHAQVREGLLKAFREAGLEPQVQKAWVPVQGTGLAHVQNVMARLKGTGTGPAVALVTHYDTVPSAPWAADAGAGVAAVLEVLRALQAGPPLVRDVVFLLTDGEELGMAGAQAFAQDHPWARDLGFVVNMEARGTSGPVLLFETSLGNRDLIAAFAASVPHPVGNSLAATVYRHMPNNTDLTVFKQAGLRGVNFAFIEEPWHYHTPFDRREALDLGSLQHLGEGALGMVQAYGRGTLGAGDGRDAVFFNLPGLIQVSERVLPFFLGGLILLVALLWARAFRGGYVTPRKLARGMGWVLILGGLGALGAFLLFALLSRLHPLWAGQTPLTQMYNRWYLASILAGTLALLGVTLRRLIRSTGPEPLQTAALGVWSLLGSILAWTLPGLSYLILVPLLCAALGIWIQGLSTSRMLRLCGLGVMLLPGLALLVPTVDAVLVGLGLTGAMAAGTGMFLALCVALWSGPGALLQARTDQTLTWSLLGLCLGCGLVGGLWARRTTEALRTADLRTVVDASTQRAWQVARSRSADMLLPGGNQGYPDLLRPGQMLEGSIPHWRHRDLRLTATPAAARMELLGTSVEGGLHRARLRLVPGEGQELWVMGDSPAFRWLQVEGVPALGRPLSRTPNWTLRLFGLPAEGAVVEVAHVAAGESVSLRLLGRSDGLGEPPAWSPDRPSPGSARGQFSFRVWSEASITTR